MTPEAAGRTLTNVEVVTWALAELGGVERSVHLEEVADRAHEIAPGVFRWDLPKYQNRIAKEKVRRSLGDATASEYGALVRAAGATRGEKNRYWRLTPEGVSWVRENEERIREIVGGPTPKLQKKKATAIRKQLTTSPLYIEYERSGKVTPNPYAFTDLLECSPDAAENVVEERFNDLKVQTQLIGEPELLEFLLACASSHADLLGRS